MGSTTQADWDAEDYSIEREADKVYIHLNHHHEEDSWFYCLDGIGGVWYDSLEELEEDYEYEEIVYYYREQLQG